MAKPLSPKQAAARIKDLREKIKYHEKKYYVDNNPQISDHEFDLLTKELGELGSSAAEMSLPKLSPS